MRAIYCLQNFVIPLLMFWITGSPVFMGGDSKA